MAQDKPHAETLMRTGREPGGGEDERRCDERLRQEAARGEKAGAD